MGFVGASLLFWGASTAPALAQVGVLVDASKDRGVWWFPQLPPFDPNLPHQGKALADHLRSQGMIVDEVPRSSTITYEQLSRYRLVVAAGACASHSASEVSAYHRYISDGGQLVLLGDLTCTSDTLAQSLGLDFTGSFIGPINSFTPHRITEGVASLPFLFGGIVATPPATATILGRLAGIPVMGIMPFGSGRVFFLGDTNGIEQVPLPFVNNLFRFMLGSTLGDFDGDGKADISLFRPSTGMWYLRGISAITWGGGGDIPVAGDYDGDGKSDIAVFRPSTGVWYLRGIDTVTWGGGGDIPVVGDYDGDGRSDIAIFRPSTSTWYIRNISTVMWGGGGDIPVVGDYDGDGKADIAVFRPSTGVWYVRGISTTTWGGAGDIPVAGDYDGDGKTDIGVFRPSTGVWYIRGISTTTYGGSGDIPVPGDYDGDGKTDIAIFRPSTGAWFVTTLGSAVTWGGSGDIPILKRP